MLAPAFSEAVIVPQILSWDEAVQKTLVVSNLLKIADVDVALRKTDIQENRAAYFPTLTAAFSTEYRRDLSELPPGVNAVGDSTIVNTTAFQNSASINARWILFDFGKRKRRLDMAKLSVTGQEAAAQVQKRELLLNLLTAYSERWYWQEIQALRTQMETVAKDSFTTQKRLHQAGVISKPDLANSSLELVEAQEQLALSNEQLSRATLGLSRLTREPYEPDLLSVSALTTDTETETLTLDPETLPDVKQLDADIAGKERELSLLRREQWTPTVTGYSSMVFFGRNRNNPLQGMSNLDTQTAVAGVTLTMPLFDGFAANARQKRAELEIKRLKLQKQQVVDEAKDTWKETQTLQTVYQKQLPLRQDGVEQAKDLETMSQQLSDQQLLARNDLLMSRMRRLTQTLDLVDLRRKQHVAAKRLEILSTGESE